MFWNAEILIKKLTALTVEDFDFIFDSNILRRVPADPFIIYRRTDSTGDRLHTFDKKKFRRFNALAHKNWAFFGRIVAEINKNGHPGRLASYINRSDFSEELCGMKGLLEALDILPPSCRWKDEINLAIKGCFRDFYCLHSLASFYGFGSPRGAIITKCERAFKRAEIKQLTRRLQECRLEPSERESAVCL